MQKLAIIVGVLTFVSCNLSSTNKEKQIHSDPLRQERTATETTMLVKEDTLHKLFELAINQDTLEFNNWKPFLFFKSGHFLSETEKNAVLVTCPTDSTYFIRLYTLQNNKWTPNDSINNLSAHPTQFYTIYNDYNFDRQTDIYIQVSASNGYSLSYGHLLTIDPLTKKFTEQIEASRLANIRPDTKTKTVISEEVIWCKTNGLRKVGMWTNKWVNGHLKTIKKDSPCDSDSESQN